MLNKFFKTIEKKMKITDEDKMKIPEGTIHFTYSSEDLMNDKVSGEIIFERVAGAHIFRLERTDDFFLKFYYSSPGTGTRVATIDLHKAVPCAKATIVLTWSPSEISLSFGPLVKNGELLSEKGEKCTFQLKSGENGGVCAIGDTGIEIMGEVIIEDGKEILSSTAINSWEDTKKSLEILKTGESQEGYIYETITANIIISFLVTGFETYNKKRVLELEKEGITPNLRAIFPGFKKYIEYKLLERKAKNNGMTLLEYMISKRDRRTNFQSYDFCRTFFNKVFGIKFDSIGVLSEDIRQIKEFIVFRHRVVHVSPLISIFNQSSVPEKEPIFSNKVLADEAIKLFDLFINRLHKETLEKRI